ncbi:hypothetical protein Chor_013238 [Crotalus horridus]
MGGKQSTAGTTAAGRSRGGPLAGVASDDSAVPPPGGAPHFGHYRGAGTGGGGGSGGSSAMGLRSRSVSSVAGVGVGMGGVEPAGAGSVPFGLYAAASAASTTAASAAAAAAASPGDSELGPGGGSGADSTPYAHGNGYQETGGGHHRDGMLYLGSRASLADALPLHLGPRWFSSHSGEWPASGVGAVRGLRGGGF